MTRFDKDAFLAELRERAKKRIEHMKRWEPIERRIRAEIEAQFGWRSTFICLRIASSEDLGRIGVLYVFETDAEFQKAEERGQCELMVETITKVVWRQTNVSPEIRLESPGRIRTEKRDLLTRNSSEPSV